MERGNEESKGSKTETPRWKDLVKGEGKSGECEVIRREKPPCGWVGKLPVGSLVHSLFMIQTSWLGPIGCWHLTEKFLELLLVSEMQVLASHRTASCSLMCTMRLLMATRWQHISRSWGGLVGAVRPLEQPLASWAASCHHFISFKITWPCVYSSWLNLGLCLLYWAVIYCTFYGLTWFLQQAGRKITFCILSAQRG